MAPKSFTRVGEKSAVYKQPSSREERLEALQALLSCPTSSIHTEKPPHDIKEVQKTFPIPIDEKRIPGIYHCGYNSVKSYGASSYFIVHPEGNILVDSPKYTEALARNLEELGGVRFMFLTHRDDVADHEKWSKRFNCERILHSLEVQDSTVGVERKLEGTGPWSLYPDIELIFAPGHTEGDVCLYHKSLKVLFPGDHLMLWGSKLDIVEAANWFSVPLQLESVKILLDVDFEWVLPGHGRRASFRDAAEKNLAIEALLDSKLQMSKKSSQELAPSLLSISSPAQKRSGSRIFKHYFHVRPTRFIRKHLLMISKKFRKHFRSQSMSRESRGIYHCGYHSEKSFAATSYFIVHPEGNIPVDSPRYTEALASNLELLGGARDDIADHEKWPKRLNCERILHSTEELLHPKQIALFFFFVLLWFLFLDSCFPLFSSIYLLNQIDLELVLETFSFL
ncbi:hypothetical protein AKJ16_DCAP24195 [Drosera capensis]